MYTNTININLNSIYNGDVKYNVKKYTFNNNVYNIVKYNKEVLKSLEGDDYKELANFRSIIIKDNNIINELIR